MKKILIILLITFTLALSGCDKKDTYITWIDNDVTYECWQENTYLGGRSYHCSFNGSELEMDYGEYKDIRDGFNVEEFIEALIDEEMIEPIFYTQEEVDEMFIKLYEDVDNAFTEVDEMEFGIRNDISSLREWNRNLEQRIDELQEPIIYTECNMMQLAHDILVVGTQGYTFEIDQYGTMYELKDGVYTGDTFTNEDLLDEFCTIENGDE